MLSPLVLPELELDGLCLTSLWRGYWTIPGLFSLVRKQACMIKRALSPPPSSRPYVRTVTSSRSSSDKEERTKQSFARCVIHYRKRGQVESSFVGRRQEDLSSGPTIDLLGVLDSCLDMLGPWKNMNDQLVPPADECF